MNGHCMMAATLSDVIRERMKGRKKKRTRKRTKRRGKAKGKAQAVEAVEGFAVNKGQYITVVKTEVHDDLPAASPTDGKRMRPTNHLLMWPL